MVFAILYLFNSHETFVAATPRKNFTTGQKMLAVLKGNSELLLEAPREPLKKSPKEPRPYLILDTDDPTGTFVGAGVIYSPSFIKRAQRDAGSFSQPHAFTPYIDDYVRTIRRPPMKPLTRY